MAIDDELSKSAIAAEIREEAERTIQEMLARSGLAGIISLIPHGVGSAINEMLSQLASRRTHERMAAMFDEMARHIRELGEEKINREWFRSEEFQTLLFEALRQLHVTHHKEKVEMLGRALANSGSIEMTAENRKELFIQLVRELTPRHIEMLLKLSPLPKSSLHEFGPDVPKDYPAEMVWQSRPGISPGGEEGMILQMLAGNGLVQESLKTIEARTPSIGAHSSQSDIERAVKDFIKQLQRPPVRYFYLSELGRDFLKFTGLGKKSSPQAA